MPTPDITESGLYSPYDGQLDYRTLFLAGLRDHEAWDKRKSSHSVIIDGLDDDADDAAAMRGSLHNPYATLQQWILEQSGESSPSSYLHLDGDGRPMPVDVIVRPGPITPFPELDAEGALTAPYDGSTVFSGHVQRITESGLLLPQGCRYFFGLGNVHSMEDPATGDAVPCYSVLVLGNMAGPLLQIGPDTGAQAGYVLVDGLVTCNYHALGKGWVLARAGVATRINAHSFGCGLAGAELSSPGCDGSLLDGCVFEQNNMSGSLDGAGLVVGTPSMHAVMIRGGAIRNNFGREVLHLGSHNPSSTDGGSMIWENVRLGHAGYEMRGAKGQRLHFYVEFGAPSMESTFTFNPQGGVWRVSDADWANGGDTGTVTGVTVYEDSAMTNVADPGDDPPYYVKYTTASHNLSVGNAVNIVGTTPALYSVAGIVFAQAAGYYAIKIDQKNVIDGDSNPWTSGGHVERKFATLTLVEDHGIANDADHKVQGADETSMSVVEMGPVSWEAVGVQALDFPDTDKVRYVLGSDPGSFQSDRGVWTPCDISDERTHCQNIDIIGERLHGATAEPDLLQTARPYLLSSFSNFDMDNADNEVRLTDTPFGSVTIPAGSVGKWVRVTNAGSPDAIGKVSNIHNAGGTNNAFDLVNDAGAAVNNTSGGNVTGTKVTYYPGWPIPWAFNLRAARGCSIKCRPITNQNGQDDRYYARIGPYSRWNDLDLSPAVSESNADVDADTFVLNEAPPSTNSVRVADKKTDQLTRLIQRYAHVWVPRDRMNNGPIPGDNGLISWSEAPSSLASKQGTAGHVNLRRMAVREPETVHRIDLYVQLAGATLTNSFVGLYEYSDSNSLALAATYTVTTEFDSTGAKRLVLPSDYDLTLDMASWDDAAKGFYVCVAVLIGAAGTRPFFRTSAASGEEEFRSIGPRNNSSRASQFRYSTAGQTALPSTIAANQISSPSTCVFWCGLERP